MSRASDALLATTVRRGVGDRGSELSEGAKEVNAGDVSASASGRGVKIRPEAFEETRLPVTPELALVDPNLAEWARAQLREADLAEATRATSRRLSGRIVARSALGVPPGRPATPIPDPAPLQVSQTRGAYAGVSRPAGNAWRMLLWAVSLVSIGAGLTLALRSASPENNVSGSRRSDAEARTVSTAAAGSAKPAPRSDGTKGAQRTGRPGAGSATPGPRVFIWAPVRGAAFYEFELFRKQTKIFEARPTETRVALPTHWVYRRKRFSLMPGHYNWIVRPAFGSRRRGQLGRPVVLAKLAVAR